MLKNQKFGVEVEMTGISRERAAKVVAEIFGTTPSRPDGTCYETRTITDQAARKWKVMRDSSITPIRNDGGSETIDQYRVEFVTPPLNYEDIDLLQRIIRKLKENGAKPHSSCGIHIHVDGANQNPKSLRRLINFMTSRQNLIYEALEIGQREGSWCHKLNTALLDEMKKHKELTKERAEQIWYSSANDGYTGGIDHSHYNHTRYHGVNLHSYFSKGTVEFRLFNSTLHAGKIKAYIPAMASLPKIVPAAAVCSVSDRAPRLPRKLSSTPFKSLAFPDLSARLIPYLSMAASIFSVGFAMFTRAVFRDVPAMELFTLAFAIKPSASETSSTLYFIFRNVEQQFLCFSYLSNY